MHKNPTDPARNVLYNETAMAILDDACRRLRALGLVCGFGPESIFPDSDMAAVLHVSTSEDAFDKCIAGSLLASQYAERPEGREEFDEVLATFRSNCAITRAMNGPAAGAS